MTDNVNKAPKYLDLDAVKPDVDVVVKLAGKEHKLVPITLEDFVENTKKIQSMAVGAAGDLESEMDLVIGMLVKTFPTMTTDMLRKLTMPQLNQLLAFAQANNGGDEVKADAEKDATAGNPPKAS